MDDTVEKYWLRLSVRESGLLCFFLYIGYVMFVNMKQNQSLLLLLSLNSLDAPLLQMDFPITEFTPFLRNADHEIKCGYYNPSHLQHCKYYKSQLLLDLLMLLSLDSRFLMWVNNH